MVERRHVIGGAAVTEEIVPGFSSLFDIVLYFTVTEFLSITKKSLKNIVLLPVNASISVTCQRRGQFKVALGVCFALWKRCNLNLLITKFKTNRPLSNLFVNRIPN